MLELKVLLVLLVRRFEFREGYDELYARRRRRRRRERGGGGSWFSPGVGKDNNVKGKDKGGGAAVREVKEWGGKAYYVSLASNKPKEGIPVWVREVVVGV